MEEENDPSQPAALQEQEQELPPERAEQPDQVQAKRPSQHEQITKDDLPPEDLARHEEKFEQPAEEEAKHYQAQEVMQEKDSQPQGLEGLLSRSVEKRLRQIFDFYCKQENSTTTKQSPTFDRVLHKLEVLIMNKWMLFCREFQLLGDVSASSLHDMFKRHSHHNQLNFEEFKECLIQILSKVFPSIEEGLMTLRVATEESWKGKCTELGIPYFEKTNSQRPLAKINLKSKQHPKMGRELVTLTPTKPLPSKPVESIRKKQFNYDFQEVSQLKMKLDISIDREDEDDIYLKEYMLTPREDINPNKKIENKSQVGSKKGHLAKECGILPNMERKLSTLQGKRTIPTDKENNVSQGSSSGIIKRLDDKINRFRRK